MDFSQYTDDALADVTRDLLEELHGRIDSLATPHRARGQRVLKVLHAAADALKDWAVEGSIISPASGGDAKP